MIERTTMSSTNEFFASTKTSSSRKAAPALPVRREIDGGGASDPARPAESSDRFAENLNAATTERTVENSNTPTPAIESAVEPESSTGTDTETTPAVPVEDQAGTEVTQDGAGTVAEWVAAFEQLTEKPLKTNETTTLTLNTVPRIDVEEAAPVIQDVAPAETAAVTVEDVNPLGYTDVITMPTDSIAPAADPAISVALTSATVISPADFVAAQEAIQRAAAQTVRETAAPGIEMRSAFTTAQAASAALRTAVVKQQTFSEEPRPTHNIIDHRTGLQGPATVVAPATTQLTQNVTAAPAKSSDEPTAGPIHASGAQTRATEIETEQGPKPMPSVAPAAAFDAMSAPDLGATDTAAARPASGVKVELPTPMTRDQFTAANEPAVVKSVAGLIKDNGGEMRIRLDPPSLGNVSVRVKMTGGAAEISFVTPSGDAAKALGQSLHTLKHSLEAAGVQVDRINVRQAQPTDNQANTNSDTRDGDDPATRDHRQNEQQRARDELARRWRNVIYGDDLDAAA